MENRPGDPLSAGRPLCEATDPVKLGRERTGLFMSRDETSDIVQDMPEGSMNRQNAEQPANVTAQRRQREKELRCRSILQTAERLFCEHGYPNTKMQDIAGEAEVAVGTVYFYFRNKEDLLLQLMDDIAFNIRNILGEAFQTGKTPMERFENAGRAFFEKFCLAHPFHVIILLRESVGITPEVESRREAIFELFREDVDKAIVEVMEEYVLANRFVAEVLSVAMVGMLERVAYQYLIWQDRSDDMDTITAEAMSFIRGGLLSVLRNLSRNGDGEGKTEL
jgi:AcrR family transcriptional regulator